MAVCTVNRGPQQLQQTGFTNFLTGDFPCQIRDIALTLTLEMRLEMDSMDIDLHFAKIHVLKYLPVDPQKSK